MGAMYRGMEWIYPTADSTGRQWRGRQRSVGALPRPWVELNSISHGLSSLAPNTPAPDGVLTTIISVGMGKRILCI